jgi:predicted GIY-YIG superfamily endonuclease/uncharacterized protein YoxC
MSDTVMPDLIADHSILGLGDNNLITLIMVELVILPVIIYALNFLSIKSSKEIDTRFDLLQSSLDVMHNEVKDIPGDMKEALDAYSVLYDDVSRKVKGLTIRDEDRTEFEKNIVQSLSMMAQFSTDYESLRSQLKAISNRMFVLENNKNNMSTSDQQHKTIANIQSFRSEIEENVFVPLMREMRMLESKIELLEYKLNDQSRLMHAPSTEPDDDIILTAIHHTNSLEDGLHTPSSFQDRMFLPQRMLLSPMGENKNINEDRHTIISSHVGGAVLKEKVKSTTTKMMMSSTALGVAADVKYDFTSMIKESINNSSSLSSQHLLLDDENYDDYDDDENDTISEDSSETMDTIGDVKRSFCVYLLVNDKNKCTYIGMTNNMTRRLRQHNGEIVGGARYTTLKRGEGSWYYYGYVMNLSKSMALSIEKKIQKRTRKTKGSSPLDRRLNCIEQLLRDEYPHDGISFLRLF